MINALIVVMVVAAILAVGAKNLFFELFCLGLLGFSLGGIFVFSRAPIQGLIQIVLTLASLYILKKVFLKEESAPSAAKREPFVVFIAIAFAAIILLFSAASFTGFPENTRPIEKRTSLAADISGKAYIYFLEAVIIIAAGMGAYSLLRRGK